MTASGRERAVSSLALYLLVSWVALLIHRIAPPLSPLLTCLILGVVAANGSVFRGITAWRHPPLGSFCLRLGIVLLGLSLSMTEISAIGWEGGTVVVVTAGAAFWCCWVVGRRLSVDPALLAMIAGGTAICGASAVLAVQERLRAAPRDLGAAVAVVTFFGTIALCVVPWMSFVLGLNALESGLWAGASIHEVGQVVVATSFMPEAALAIGTGSKLMRVALLVPLCLLVPYLTDRHIALQGGPAKRARLPRQPLYLYGFAAAVVAGNSALLPEGVFVVGSTVSTLALGAAMFGIGLGMPRTLLSGLNGGVLAVGTAGMAVALIVPLLVVSAVEL